MDSGEALIFDFREYKRGHRRLPKRGAVEDCKTAVEHQEESGDPAGRAFHLDPSAGVLRKAGTEQFGIHDRKLLSRLESAADGIRQARTADYCA
jgi:hypothetical protein